jgi:class 3 adenylate cyclase/pimeloyl-ACP methyl ester carboxylesterase
MDERSRVGFNHVDTPPLRYARTSDGISIAYLEAGSGPPMVVLPHYPFSFAEREWHLEPWQRWYRWFTRAHRVIRLDHRGTGLSTRGVADHSLTGLVSDIEAVVSTAEVGRCTLVGLHGSVHIAIGFAAEHPDLIERLVLWNGSATSLEVARNPKVRSLTSAARNDRSTYFHLLTELSMNWAEPQLANELSAMYEDAVDEDELRAMFLQPYDVTDGLPAIEADTLVLHSAAEPLAELAWAQRIATAIPRAQLRVLEGASGFPFREEGAAGLQAISDFLEDGLTAPPTLRRAAGDIQTVLFTDLVGSTELQRRLGDRGARETLRAHDEAARVAIEEFGGREVKHTGDGIMSAFGSAVDAVECALVIQQSIETYNDSEGDEELLVRFGLNAGEPIREGEDLFGLSVTLAARIGDWGEPGQVFITDVVRQLLLGKGFNFESIGAIDLKGFDEPVPVYRVQR